MKTVSLIVMEESSEWPGHVGTTESLVAVACGDDELLRRTRARIDLLRRQGERVRIAVLACGVATDVASSARRAALVDELLGAVAPARFGRIVLCSGDQAPASLRAELLSLAGLLSQRLKGTSCSVSVRFGRGAEESRVSARAALRKCVPALEPSSLQAAGV